MIFHIEDRKDTLIITNLKDNKFKIVPNDAINRVKYLLYNGKPINLKLNDMLSLSETSETFIFKVKYGDSEHTTDYAESNLIGEIINLSFIGQKTTSIELLTEYVETELSNKIQKDIILYLLSSYAERLKFFEEYIEIDGIFRVYYDCWNNHQEVLSHTVKNPTFKSVGEKRFKSLCLVRKNFNDFKPTWFKIRDKNYVLTSKGCEVVSKTLFLLEFEKHKSDKVFWSQVKHIFKENLRSEL